LILAVLILKRLKFICVLAAFGWLGAAAFAFAADPPMKNLHGHVPTAVLNLPAKGTLPATNQLNLAIGLPLRDAQGLDDYLARITDPASADYRKYLTPEQFTERFAPTEHDYQSVIDFAKRNHLTITATSSNRLLLDVSGSVADVQHALHITMHTYRHPNQMRDFFAPDIEPSVDASLPIADISGLNDYVLPQPKNLKMNSAPVTPQSGSGSGGSYLGNDFRAAYLPGVTLTGSGQMVGLLEFDGYFSGDIAGYEAQAGLSPVPLQNILLDNFNGTPTSGANSGDGEVSLDIEMVVAMAPGLSKIVLFEAGPHGNPNDVLNSMVANNQVKQFSCSWGWGGGPSTTTDNIFKQMAAQGQSFFCASGDSDAFTTGSSSVNGVDNSSLPNAPSSNPYITVVGGTTLSTTGAGGSWSGETVWNWGLNKGSYVGSSGGISSFYAIPSWQKNVNMTASGGSSTLRNIPDVAMVADDVYVQYNNGQIGAFGGTSCAAPLWAAVAALANQQAAANSKPLLGFINPAIYAIGTSQNYAQDFHDVIIGDNTWSSSPSQFFAVAGYDNCTGWGSPAGQKLIDDLAGQGSSPASSTLGIFSITRSAASGGVGGPFVSPATIITLTNSGTNSLDWTLTNPTAASWLNIYPTSGTLTAHAIIAVTADFTAAANTLVVGNYPVTLKFANVTSAATQPVTFTFQVLPDLSVTPASGFIAIGTAGGPFIPVTQDYLISNLGGTDAVWKIKESGSWLAVSQLGGTVTAHGQSGFTVSLTPKAYSLKAGLYKATVTVSDAKKKTIQSLPFTLSIGQSIVANGGFETGNFSGWNLNATTTQVGKTKPLIHSGKYGADLGQLDTLGYLSQNVPTIAGQTYLLSLWLDNPVNTFGATPNEFQVQWEGNTIYDAIDLPFTVWTNLQFVVTATTTGSELQFGFQDEPSYLGLDDISVKPIVIPAIRAAARTPAAANTPATFDLTFAAMPGETYQVQYKTNFTQPNWLNLGNPFIAETNSVKFSDPTIGGSPQKYYRLMLVPSN
jgi:Pro-kumamolisin, activation domain/Viral BACON domain